MLRTYSIIELCLLMLWGHIRELAQDLQWYHSFFAKMDDYLKIETLAAILILDERNRNSPPDEEIKLEDVPYDCIDKMACRARSQHIDPVAVLMNLASPEARAACDDALADTHMNVD